MRGGVVVTSSVYLANPANQSHKIRLSGTRSSFHDERPGGHYSPPGQLIGGDRSWRVGSNRSNE